MSGLRKKVILSMLIVGSLPLILGLLLAYVRGTYELRNTIGHNFEGLAGEVAHKTDLIIAKELGELRHYTSSSDVIRTIEASNKAYNVLSPSEIEKRLKEGEATWDTEKRPGVHPKGILGNLGSRYLVKSTTVENKEKINAALFVTDKIGAVVASINGYPKYLNSGEEWWNKTYNDGKGKVYLGNEYFDEVAKAHVWEVAIPVINEENDQVIGTLKAVLKINEFFQPSIFHIRFGKTGHAMLVDSEGKVIICPVLPTGAHIADKQLISLVTSPHQGWIRAENDAHGGRNSIVGFAPIEDANQILKGSVGRSWHSFIRQDPKELYSPLYAMLRDVIIYGVLLIGVIITAGLIMSERLVQPIKALQEGAEIIGRGNLDHRLTITTNDEIGVLGDKFNEMTEKLKRSYLEIEDSLEKLKEMDKFKSEFISLVSHELRTPLTSIIGFSELLIDRVPGEINMVQEEYIKNVQSSGQQLLEIINNLLDISKLQAGKLELVLSDFDIRGLISEVEGSVMPLINRKELSFENRIEDGIPMIYADRAKIKQTLLNLISNAIKFTPKGGFVRVDV
ncbi:MAG: sensor histidine kinase, partial [Nitrospirota bacterium]